MKLHSMRHSGPIGCALSASIIRLVQLQTDRSGKVHLETAAEPWASSESAAGDSPIRNTLARGRFSGRRIVTAPDEDVVQYRTIRLAQMPEAELSLAVHWQAVGLGGASPEEIVTAHYDCHPAESNAKEGRKVLSVIAKRSWIQSHVAALTAAKLLPVAIDAPAGAVARCFRGWATTVASEPLLIVQPGRLRTLIMAVRNGVPFFLHSIEAGWMDVAKSLVGTDGDPNPLAAVLAYGPNAPVSVNAVQTSMVDASTALLEHLAPAIAMSMHHLADDPGGLEPRVTCVVGAGTLEQAIIDELGSRIDLDIRRVNDVIAPSLRDLVDPIVAGETIDRWLLPLGLALYGHQHLVGEPDDAPRITLVPETASFRTRRRRLARNAAFTSIAVLLLLWMLLAIIQVRSLDHRIERAHLTLSRSMEHQQGVEALRDKERELRHHLREGYPNHDALPWTAIIALLSQKAPTDLFLQRLVIKRAGRSVSRPGHDFGETMLPALALEMEGLAADDAAVTSMISSMSDAGIFRNVRLQENRRSAFNGKPLQEFRLISAIGGASGGTH